MKQSAVWFVQVNERAKTYPTIDQTSTIFSPLFEVGKHSIIRFNTSMTWHLARPQPWASFENPFKSLTSEKVKTCKIIRTRNSDLWSHCRTRKIYTSQARFDYIRDWALKPVRLNGIKIFFHSLILTFCLASTRDGWRIRNCTIYTANKFLFIPYNVLLSSERKDGDLKIKSSSLLCEWI